MHKKGMMKRAVDVELEEMARMTHVMCRIRRRKKNGTEAYPSSSHI